MPRGSTSSLLRAASLAHLLLLLLIGNHTPNATTAPVSTVASATVGVCREVVVQGGQVKAQLSELFFNSQKLYAMLSC